MSGLGEAQQRATELLGLFPGDLAYLVNAEKAMVVARDVLALVERVEAAADQLAATKQMWHEAESERVAAEARVKVLEEALRQIGGAGGSPDAEALADMARTALAAVSSSPTPDAMT